MAEFLSYRGLFDIVKKRFTRFVVYHVRPDGLLLIVRWLKHDKFERRPRHLACLWLAF